MFATKKELSINLKLQENIWSVEVDSSQIDQVLLNLYVNAWQAMPGGGQLTSRPKTADSRKISSNRSSLNPENMSRYRLPIPVSAWMMKPANEF